MESGDIKFVDFNSAVALLNSELPAGNNLDDFSYDVFNSQVYLYFAVKGDNLDLDLVHE